MGDLVLTCTDDRQRNRRLGLAIAAGRSAEDAVAEEIGQAVEGWYGARAVRDVARTRGVDMPICRRCIASSTRAPRPDR